jgi:hypothetical protein
MVNAQIVNLCRSEHISVCAAANQAEQKGCSFYERARSAERCMYFIFEEYCDCLKAQLNAAAPRP